MLRSHVDDHGLVGDGVLAFMTASGALDDVFDARGDHVLCCNRSH